MLDEDDGVTVVEDERSAFQASDVWIVVTVAGWSSA